MSRKDYALIAEEIKNEASVLPDSHREEWLALQHLAKRLARRFAEENPKFDSYRFVNACGF